LIFCVLTILILKKNNFIETLNPNETATECFCLKVESNCNDNSSEQAMNKIPTLGDYFIEWRRKSFLGSKLNESKQSSDSESDSEESDTESNIPNRQTNDFFNVKTKIVLPEITAERFPFYIDTIMPACGSMTEPLIIVYKIHNKIDTFLDIECNLEQNEFFALAGKKMVTIIFKDCYNKSLFLIYSVKLIKELVQILPNDFYNYQFILQPLQAGYCKLPNFHIKLNNYNYQTQQSDSNTNAQQVKPSSSQTNTSFDLINSLDPILKNMLPSQIFIFPEKLETLLTLN